MSDPEADIKAVRTRPDPLTILLPGDIPMEFRLIPKGEARLGQRGGGSREEPVCRVKIAEDFYLGTYPVTQQQLEAWTGTEDYRWWFKKHRELLRRTNGFRSAELHHNGFKGRPLHPAEQVTWWEAQEFSTWLTALVQGQGGQAELEPPWHARLPTEAEWEYACRAGTDTEYWSGDGELALANVGWYRENSNRQTRAVGEKPANAYGLHDMHGNVKEWCLDACQDERYRTSVDSALDTADQTNSTDADPVLRGGGWGDKAWDCRAAYRSRFWPGHRLGDIGFRLAWVPGSGSRSGGAVGPGEAA